MNHRLHNLEALLLVKLGGIAGYLGRIPLPGDLYIRHGGALAHDGADAVVGKQVDEVLCCWKSDFVREIQGFPIQGNLLEVKFDRVYVNERLMWGLR